MGLCGEHPGSDWVLNSPGTTHYYRFIIPDPTNCQPIVAPFLLYNLYIARPEVHATFGKGCQIYRRTLQLTPVDYTCPPLTPEQLCVFDTQEPFAYAVNKVINDYFPHDLSTAIWQYQHHKQFQYVVQSAIRHLQDKKYKHLEKALEVLSDLEDANVLGRLLAHADVIDMAFDSNDDHHHAWAQVLSDFRGHITQSALDPRINPYRSIKGEPIPTFFPSRACSKERNHLEVRYMEHQDRLEERIRKYSAP